MSPQKQWKPAGNRVNEFQMLKSGKKKTVNQEFCNQQNYQNWKQNKDICRQENNWDKNELLLVGLPYKKY